MLILWMCKYFCSFDSYSLVTKADSSTFQRFDRFNKKYNPLGYTELRNIFLKIDNFLNGRYIAEMTLDVKKLIFTLFDILILRR